MKNISPEIDKLLVYCDDNVRAISLPASLFLFLYLSCSIYCSLLKGHFYQSTRSPVGGCAREKKTSRTFCLSQLLLILQKKEKDREREPMMNIIGT